MEKYKPHVFMVAVQIAYAGLIVISKAALTTGMSYFILVVYRHIIATVVLGPFAFFLERKKRPSITFYNSCMIWLLAICGITIQQNLYLAGLKYTSSTFASASSNMIPALTFVVAVLLRLEKLRIKSLPGQAKVLGTVICIIGALIVTLYKGPVIPMPWSPSVHVKNQVGDTNHLSKNWIKGSLLIITSYITWTAWIILQAKITEIYPAQLSLITLMCFAASLQSAVIAFIFERNLAVWALHWNLQLLTVLYAGIVVSVAVYCLQMWCIGKKGPVFTAMFSPVLSVIVSILSPIVLDERLHLGSVLGGVFVVIGLYTVLWGKRKDVEDMSTTMIPLERSENTPTFSRAQEGSLNIKKSAEDAQITCDHGGPNRSV